MTDRVWTGPLFGTAGLFISQPGDSVTNPTLPLLFDSRFDSLSVHTAGRVQIPVISNGSSRTWQGSWGFPALPYLPMFWFSLVERGDNFAYYPPGNFFFDPVNTAPLNHKACDVDQSNIRVKAETVGGGSPPARMQLDLQYIIFKNPR